MQTQLLGSALGWACLLVWAESSRAASIEGEDGKRDGITVAVDGKGWFSFAPKPDTFADSPIDLRFLNERFAGEHGFIGTKDGHFIHTANGQPVRFWAVNGPAREDKDRAALRQTARVLAQYGVNLVRRHSAVFDKDGEVDRAAVKRAIAIVEEMKAEGIYTHASIGEQLYGDEATRRRRKGFFTQLKQERIPA